MNSKDSFYQPTDNISIKEAAYYLNVSNEYILKLIQQGDIDFVITNEETKINFEHLEAYKKKIKVNQKELLSKVIQTNQQLGLY